MTTATQTIEHPAVALAQVMRDEHGSVFGCPIMDTLELIRRKWATQILYALHRSPAPLRFNTIERALAPITQKELTKRLRELERAGVVCRTVYAEVPPRVEYTLTPLGASLMPLLDGLTAWGRAYRAQSHAMLEANE